MTHSNRHNPSCWGEVGGRHRHAGGAGGVSPAAAPLRRSGRGSRWRWRIWRRGRAPRPPRRTTDRCRSWCGLPSRTRCVWSPAQGSPGTATLQERTREGEKGIRNTVVAGGGGGGGNWRGLPLICLRISSSGTKVFSRVFPIFPSQRATSSLKETMFAGGRRYRILFRVRGSSTALIVYSAMSSSNTKMAAGRRGDSHDRRSSIVPQTDWGGGDLLRTFGVAVAEDDDLVARRRGGEPGLGEGGEEVGPEEVGGDDGVGDALWFHQASDIDLGLERRLRRLLGVDAVDVVAELRREEPLQMDQADRSADPATGGAPLTIFPLLTLTLPASLMAATILLCSGSWAVPTAEMTTSTCLNALTRLSWSSRSPCGRPNLQILSPLGGKKTGVGAGGGPYMEEGDARVLEALEERRLLGACGLDGALTDEEEGRIPRLGAGLDDELSNVPGSPDHQHAALPRRRHSRCLLSLSSPVRSPNLSE